MPYRLTTIEREADGTLIEVCWLTETSLARLVAYAERLGLLPGMAVSQSLCWPHGEIVQMTIEGSPLPHAAACRKPAVG